MKSSEFLGYPIVNKCPCGKRVNPEDAQELVFDQESGRWMRECSKCVSRASIKRSESQQDAA